MSRSEKEEVSVHRHFRFRRHFVGQDCIDVINVIFVMWESNFHFCDSRSSMNRANLRWTFAEFWCWDIPDSTFHFWDSFVAQYQSYANVRSDVQRLNIILWRRSLCHILSLFLFFATKPTPLTFFCCWSSVGWYAHSNVWYIQTTILLRTGCHTYLVRLLSMSSFSPYLQHTSHPSFHILESNLFSFSTK